MFHYKRTISDGRETVTATIVLPHGNVVGEGQAATEYHAGYLACLDAINGNHFDVVHAHVRLLNQRDAVTLEETSKRLRSHA